MDISRGLCTRLRCMQKFLYTVSKRLFSRGGIGGPSWFVWLGCSTTGADLVGERERRRYWKIVGVGMICGPRPVAGMITGICRRGEREWCRSG
jgi:hypothetical protein